MGNDEVEARRLGGFDFLRKPADIDLLLSKIGKAYWEKFEDVLNKIFLKVYTEVDFVARTYEQLQKLGFSAENTIACGALNAFQKEIAGGKTDPRIR